MAKTIQGKQIIEDNHLDNAIKSTKDYIEVVKVLNREIKETAGISKKGLGAVDPNTAKGIREINTEVKKSIKLREASVDTNEKLAKSTKLVTSLTDEQVKEKLRLQKANKDQRDALKAEIVLTDKLAGEEEKLLALNTKLRLERKKLTKADKNYESELKRINSALDVNNKKIIANSDNLKRQRMNVGNYGSAVSKITNVVKGFGVAMLASFSFQAIKGFFTDSIDAFRVQEKAVAKVTQAITSTGGAAGKTTKELKDLASSLQSNSLFGDEQILNDVSAQLLTFTNITGKEFDRTQQVALDLATVLDGDLKSASLQLGKALNDPVANLSALSRSGIQFSDSQKQTIKSLADTNQLAEAQNVILTELERQYGGQALAAAEADGGFTQLNNTFGDLMEVVGGALLDAIRPLIKDLKKFLESLSEDDIEKFTEALKDLISGIITLSKISFESLKGIFEFANAWRHAFESLDNFKTALRETIDSFTSFITFGLINDLSDDILGLEKATSEFNKAQREHNRVIRFSQKGIEKLKNSVTEYIGKEQERINLLVEGNLSTKEQAKLIAELNKEYPDLLENYDLENLSQEDAIKLNKELQIEITNTAILKQKVLALDLLDSEVKKKQAEIDKIQNKELREQREAELQFTKDNLLAKIDAVEKQTRIKLGLLDADDELTTGIINNDNKVVESTKKTNKKKVAEKKKHEKEISKIDLDEARKRKKALELVEDGRVDPQIAIDKKLAAEKLAQEELIKSMKEQFNTLNDLLQLALDNSLSKIDTAIQKGNNKISDSQSRIDDIKANADLSDLDAQASIKAEKQAIANERENIDALEKKSRNLKILVTGLNLANQKIQSGDGNALVSASQQMGTFVSSLQGFYKGTDTTLGESLSGAVAISGDRDTHIIKAHKDEQIIGVENSRKLGGMHQDDVVKGALMLKNGEFVGNRAVKNMNVQTAFNDSRMINAMNRVEQAIENIDIPVRNTDYSAINKLWKDQIISKGKVTNTYQKVNNGMF